MRSGASPGALGGTFGHIGDILGALTKEGGIEGKYIGKINITENNAYVAIEKQYAEQAKRHLLNNKIKNKNFGMKIIW